MTQASTPSFDLAQLDAITQGAFSAPTSGERGARVREWLATNPTPELMQAVFKELSVKDKGAAKPLRERLDELRRAKGQEALAAEWAAKAQALLDAARMNIADALAWQRDAARAGAPLSREPLATLRTALAERVRAVEDLQNQAMVQREAAVLLAQRIEVLSTRSFKDAQAAAAALQTDVANWRAQADTLTAHAQWAAVDAKFPPMIDAARTQLQVVWDAFAAALAQAEAAAADAQAPLPPVPVWADELRALRGEPVQAEAKPAARARVDPAVREALRQQALAAVLPVLEKVEQEVGEGHGKASAGAAAALRAAFKAHGRHLEAAIESRVHAALGAAGELEGWARWRADQLREELVGKAQALLTAEPALTGRKLQEALRQLREQWKAADKGGAPNHALWKRFDDACNEAHKRVEVWLETVKAENAAHRAQRLALIEEVKAWAQGQSERTGSPDWKAFSRALHQFSTRWREAGHLSEKAFAELAPLWKAAIHEAALPLEQAQKASLERRHALIEEAKALGAARELRIDAVRALQQRWQAEAQAVPLERRVEQKLWDSFRKPIDEAFQRKSAERERAQAALSERDRAVLDAAKALEAANASGDAQRIRAAMAALDAALHGQAQAQAEVDRMAASAVESEEKPANPSAERSDVATENEAMQEAPAPAPADASAAPRRVVAVRGDDRPGQKRVEPVAAGNARRPGDRRDASRDGARGPRGADPRSDTRGGPRAGGRPPASERGPRLGDAAFRAQREALEHAEAALRRLAAQAHGEALTQVLDAWHARDAAALPNAQALGRAVSASVRAAWVKALEAPASGDAAEALLRLEIAAEVPTPAAQIEARRALQLKLLTRRHDPTPADTWPQDVATVLASAWSPEASRRLQTALKGLLRRG